MSCIVAVNSQLCGALTFSGFLLPCRRVKHQFCQDIKL